MSKRVKIVRDVWAKIEPCAMEYFSKHGHLYSASEPPLFELQPRIADVPCQVERNRIDFIHEVTTDLRRKYPHHRVRETKDNIIVAQWEGHYD